MAFKSGFGAVKEAKQKAEQQRGSLDAMRTPEVYLREDSAECELWFIGSEAEEPVMVPYHSIRLGGDQYREEMCARGAEDHEGCVYCHQYRKKDKRVSKPIEEAVFNVADTRWVHKIKNEAKSSEAGFDRFEWFDCTNDENCKQCRLDKKRGKTRVRRGLARLKLKGTPAGGLDGTNSQLKRRCVSCGGKLKVTGYVNGKKTIPDLEDIDEDDRGNWTAEYECNKCSDPVPGSIWLCPVTMRRNGVGKLTSYSFTPGTFEDPPEWVQKLKPMELQTSLVPRTADNMAEQLGIDNPFTSGGGGGSKGAKPYGKEDEEEEEDPDAGEDEEEDE